MDELKATRHTAFSYHGSMPIRSLVFPISCNTHFIVAAKHNCFGVSWVCTHRKARAPPLPPLHCTHHCYQGDRCREGYSQPLVSVVALRQYLETSRLDPMPSLGDRGRRSVLRTRPSWRSRMVDEMCPTGQGRTGVGHTAIL